MRIVVWNSPDDGSVARIEVLSPAQGKRKARLDWLPVAIHGDDEADAARKANDFYQSELERFKRQADGRASRIQKMADARAAKAGDA